MHRSQVPPKPASSSSRYVHSKPGAWAVRKTSISRLSPFSKREASLLKTTTGILQHTSKYGVAKAAHEDDGFKNQGDYTLKRKSSKLLTSLKARLEKESHVFHAKLKELEPTIKSLTIGEGAPRLKNSRTLSRRLKSTHKSPEKDQLGIGLLSPPNLEGEKLITIGGYIVSMQEAHENITSVIRPRVSSDKDGLELEIKILGCNPMDIRFEKRYDTLIVIGVSKSTIQQFEDVTKGSNGPKDGKVKEVSPFRSMTLRDLGLDSMQYLPEQEYNEDVHEIINIFVPKNVSLNQILISKPDSKGRIYVKGP